MISSGTQILRYIVYERGKYTAERQPFEIKAYEMSYVRSKYFPTVCLQQSTGHRHISWLNSQLYTYILIYTENVLMI